MERLQRLRAALLLTAAAVGLALLWVYVVGPRSSGEAPDLSAAQLATAAPAAGPRLAIPVLGVDAPITPMGQDAEGNLAAPDGPHEVAWYDFTAHPGFPGNAVMAGHLNWRDGSTAVFAHLATLVPGDIVDVIEDNGEALHYRVVAVEDMDAFTTDVRQILEWTGPESLTLITCSGEYVWTAASYAQRTVVRAERVDAAGGA